MKSQATLTRCVNTEELASPKEMALGSQWVVSGRQRKKFPGTNFMSLKIARRGQGT